MAFRLLGLFHSHSGISPKIRHVICTASMGGKLSQMILQWDGVRRHSRIRVKRPDFLDSERQQLRRSDWFFKRIVLMWNGFQTSLEMEQMNVVILTNDPFSARRLQSLSWLWNAVKRFNLWKSTRPPWSGEDSKIITTKSGDLNVRNFYEIYLATYCRENSSKGNKTSSQSPTISLLAAEIFHFYHFFPFSTNPLENPIVLV